MPQEKWFIFIILIPSKNDNLCPRKSAFSSLYYCLLCLPLCRARCLSFLLKLSRMTTLLGKSWSFCSSNVSSQKCLFFSVFFSLFFFFSFLFLLFLFILFYFYFFYLFSFLFFIFFLFIYLFYYYFFFVLLVS